jgi:RHS repeat-associated protein
MVDQKYLYNGKELQEETDWYDYGARMQDPWLGRFFTQDRFSEKYYALTPYQYGADNPILFVDVNGDSLQVSGSQEATQQFLDIINQGLGGFYNASVDDNGLVTLEATEQEGELTKEQQAFVDVISEATSLETGLSTFNVVNENDATSEDVFFGDNGQSEVSATPGQHTIDVGDAQALGSDGKLTSQGVVAHEVKEGFAIQVKGSRPNIAHGRGIAAETRVTGTIIISPGGSINENRTRITVPVQRGNQRSTVTIMFRNGNVKRVRGNER